MGRLLQPVRRGLEAGMGGRGVERLREGDADDRAAFELIEENPGLGGQKAAAMSGSVKSPRQSATAALTPPRGRGGCAP